MSLIKLSRAIERLMEWGVSSYEKLRDRRKRYYKRFELDLGTARTQTEYKVYGDLVAVEECDGDVDIYLNETDTDRIVLNKGRKIYQPFWRFFITNETQTGKVCYILAGHSAGFDVEITDSLLDEIKSRSGNYISVSDKLLMSSDAEVTHDTTTYTKKKEIKIKISGEYRVTFELEGQPAVTIAYARIYKNGVGFGTIRSCTTATTFSEDLKFDVDDLVQLYLKSQVNGQDVWARDLRLKGTIGLQVGIEQDV